MNTIHSPRLRSFTLILFIITVCSLSGLLIMPVSVHAAGQAFDMSSSTNWNTRFDGPADLVGSNSRSGLGYFSLATGDVNNDGKPDLLVGNRFADLPGRLDNGSLYLVDNSILIAASSTGSILDLSNPSNYSLRIIGAEAGDSGQRVPQLADFDGDDKLDLAFAAGQFYNATSSGGHAYILYNDLLAYSGTGNTLDLADPTSWNIRFDGQTGARLLTVKAADINNDGQQDLAMQEFLPVDDVRRIYVLYNDLFSSYTGTGNVVSMAPTDTANYNLALTESDGYGLIVDDLHVADLNDNGKNDLVITAPQATGNMYVLFDDLVEQFTGTGNQIDLSDPSNYNVVFTPTWDLGAADSLGIGDVFSIGKNDIVVGDLYSPTNPSGVDLGGSMYVIPNSIINSHGSTTGNTISLEGDTAYAIRFDGDEEDDELSQGSEVRIADLDNNGKNDLIIDASGGHANSPVDPLVKRGKVYVIFDNILAPYASSTGTGLSLGSSDNFSIRYDGANPGDWLGATGLETVDLNGDDQKDIIMASWGSDENGPDTGSLYLIYYFPHQFTLDPVFTETGHEPFDVTGTVSAPDNATSISLVQWGHERSFGNASSSDFHNIWHDCVASDGTFDSNEEDFTCHHEALDIDADHASPHTVFFRAQDSKGIWTAIDNYPTETYIHDSPISDVSAIVAGIDATVTWTTSQDASSIVEYGDTSGAYTASTTETDTSPMVTSHNVTVPVPACGPYYFRVLSRDIAGNLAASDEETFPIPNCAGESTPEPEEEEEDSSSGGGSSRSSSRRATSSSPSSSMLEDELAARVEELKAQLALLQHHHGSGTDIFIFPRNLSLGDIGADVKVLQIYLNTHGFVLTLSGLGAPGQETELFGALTKAAVIRLQEAHAAEILTPLGLTKGTGYFGDATRGWVNGSV